MNKSLLHSIMRIILFAVILVAIVINFDVFFSIIGLIARIFRPVLIGFIIAFILNRPFIYTLRLFTKLFRKGAATKPAKALALTLVYLITLAFISLILGLVAPQLADSISSLRKNFNLYSENIIDFFLFVENKFKLDFSITEGITTAIITFISDIPNYISNAFPDIFTAAGNVASSVSDWIMGFAMSIYMLASKETLLKQFSRLFRAYLPEKAFKELSRITKLSADIFGNFISGQITDALIVGLICMIFMSIFGFDYAFLISVLIAVTNVIPIFGPFIGAVPSAFLLLIINPTEALWFIIFIVVLQQIDGNFICPHIVGDSIGLPAWWVLFAILIGGGLFGFIGMITGVPFFCILYRLISELTNKKEHI